MIQAGPASRECGVTGLVWLFWETCLPTLSELHLCGFWFTLTARSASLYLVCEVLFYPVLHAASYPTGSVSGAGHHASLIYIRLCLFCQCSLIFVLKPWETTLCIVFVSLFVPFKHFANKIVQLELVRPNTEDARHVNKQLFALPHRAQLDLV